MAEWTFRLLLIGGIMTVLVVASGAFRAIQGAPEPGLVKGSPYAAGGGALALFGAMAFALVGIFFSDLSTPGQFLPWLMLVGAFALSGAALLFFCTGVLARYDSTGLQVRGWQRRWIQVPWRDVRRVRSDFVGSGIVFELQSGRKILLSQDAGGLGGLIDAARMAGAPGAAKLLGLEDPSS